MFITCLTCGYDKNPADAEFCEACGVELKTPAPAPARPEPITTPTPPFVPIAPPEPVLTPPINPIEPPIVVINPRSTTASTARLIAKQTNAPQAEFPLHSVALVGIFDPDSGPVDIDLETFFGGETVSRQHAEIYPEAGRWMVKDLGSTNGVFVKPNGQSRFGARITTPTSLNPGDEVAFAKVQFKFQTP